MINKLVDQIIKNKDTMAYEMLCYIADNDKSDLRRWGAMGALAALHDSGRLNFLDEETEG